ncbi:MAG: hypothetical protein HQL36_10385 [Alphaproteobacteria bacterium]|nr:hypothetical protein [Alphaproteobacteria bacterium]MBF0251935.1 hypothetical protein [Alphaproteobacteria bacterium]
MKSRVLVRFALVFAAFVSVLAAAVYANIAAGSNVPWFVIVVVGLGPFVAVELRKVIDMFGKKAR